MHRVLRGRTDRGSGGKERGEVKGDPEQKDDWSKALRTLTYLQLDGGMKRMVSRGKLQGIWL